jgi:GTP cyclohydrolase I
VFPIIKRPDERVVTMAAHDKPAFVEDMARDLSAACRNLGVPHEVVVRNLESIHSHDAVAAVSWRMTQEPDSVGSNNYVNKRVSRQAEDGRSR